MKKEAAIESPYDKHELDCNKLFEEIRLISVLKPALPPSTKRDVYFEQSSKIWNF